MFNFSRNRSAEAQPFIRKIIDLSTPNLTRSNDARMARRYNRCLPVIISPWNRKKPNLDQIAIGITSDISDGGFAIITQAEIEHEQFVVGFFLADSMDVPWYFLADVRIQKEIVPGFNKMGMEIAEFLNENRRKVTMPLDEIVYKFLKVGTPSFS